MSIGNSSVNLLDKNVPLIRNSNDKRFADVMRADKAVRQQRINDIEHLNISDSAFSIKTADKGTVGKNSLGFVKVKSNISSGTGYFASKENSNFLNSNNLVALSGIFTINKGGRFLLNLGEKDVIIPGKVKLGVIHTAVRSVPSVTVHKVPSVNSGTFVHPTVQSVPSDTVHKDPKVSP